MSLNLIWTLNLLSFVFWAEQVFENRNTQCLCKCPTHKQISFKNDFHFRVVVLCVCLLFFSFQPSKITLRQLSQTQSMFSLLLLKPGTLTLHGFADNRIISFWKTLSQSFLPSLWRMIPRGTHGSKLGLWKSIQNTWVSWESGISGILTRYYLGPFIQSLRQENSLSRYSPFLYPSTTFS